MSDLTPIDAPALAPLTESFEFDDVESQLKASFVKVFNDLIRDRERQLNLYGMAHLGDESLLQNNLKADGLSVMKRDAVQMRFLLKAARARNERRGTLFIKKYLQAIWPNVWKLEPLWMPLATANQYPVGITPTGDPSTHFLTGRYRITLPVDSDNGLGLTELSKAFRSVLAARLMLEMRLGTVLSNTGNQGGLAIAGGAVGMTIFYGSGTLS